MLRLGPDGAPTIIAANALFEEANRTRALLVGVLRRLSERGYACALPDLPGQGESLIETRDTRLTSWRHAFAAAAATLPGRVHAVAIRGGALVDGEADVASRWYWSPTSGADAVRELARVRQYGGGEDHAGNDLAPEFLAELADAEPMTLVPLRVVRLDGDPRAADRHFAAAPPWRQSEPQGDDALEAALADDIAAWIATCVG